MSDDSLFQFDKNTPIWIYGHGFLGVPLYGRLLKEGFRVNGFVDRNANEIRREYRVILPEKLIDQSRNDIIIVSFQNIEEQEKIVNDLIQLGFNKILYLKRNTKYYPETFDMYNSIVYGNSNKCFNFPLSYNVKELYNGTYYREYDEYVVVDVPVQIVYSAKLYAPIELGMEDEQMIWNYNVCSIYEYNALFNLIFHGIEDKKYLDRYVYRLKGKTRSYYEFVENRISLYRRLFKYYTEEGIYAFRNAPSHANYDEERGCFILEDGHHRAVFLANMGQGRIPIRMGKQDYNKWINHEYIKLVQNLLDKDIYDNTPIMNPYFYNDTASIGMPEANALAIYFNRMDIREKAILDISSKFAYYSRLFIRFGAKSVIAYEKNEEKKYFTKLINQLESINSIQQVDILPDEMFDIVIICNDEVDAEKIINKKTWFRDVINKCRKHLVLKLSGDISTQSEKIKLNCRFMQYSIIYVGVKNNDMKGVVVFER